MANLNDFSPSMMRESKDIVNSAVADRRNRESLDQQKAATQSLNIAAPLQRASENSSSGIQGHNNMMGLNTLDQEKSVSLLDSIAIKEEDSTQKKFVEATASLNSIDRSGNE